MANAWYNKIDVLQEDIDRAIPKRSGHCMIAEAIKAYAPDAKRVSVDLATIRYTISGKRYIHLTPARAQEALLDFDLGVKMRPFRFGMQSPIQVVQSGDFARSRTDRQVTTVRVRGSSIPQKRGGQTPRTGALSSNSKRGLRTGRIRAFGLRSMASYTESSDARS